TDYGRRMPVKVEVKLDLPEGYDNNGSFAVSVTDDRDLLPDSSMTIASYLLLSSELRGHIEDANYYLSNDPVAAESLDALMLTQGWRRYDIPSAARGIMEEPNGYIEGGKEFSGSVKEVLTDRAVRDGSVWMMAPKLEFMQEVKTDRFGNFRISGFEFPDSTRYVIHAHTYRNRRVELSLNPELPIIATHSTAARPRVTDPNFSNYVAKSDQKYMEEHGVRSYEIPAAVVTAQRREEEGRSIYSSEIMGRAAPQVVIDRYPIDIVNILKQMPYLRVIEQDFEIIVFVLPLGMHQIPALIVFDDDVWKLPLDMLAGIPIKRVEVLPAPTSYVFGVEGAGGAVLITPDWGGAQIRMPTLHMATVTPTGYKRAAEFYSPKYETDAQRNSSSPDLRTTVYWKPNVQVTDGAAHIEFYTADSNTTYSIVLEGITTDGVVIRKTGRIR
ncbi:MAG: hypothetical protein FWE30_04980, partial [Bacteroidales bacterium]|nr:hypothetical protein [Bacteroidales bacterium]